MNRLYEKHVPKGFIYDIPFGELRRVDENNAPRNWDGTNIYHEKQEEVERKVEEDIKKSEASSAIIEKTKEKLRKYGVKGEDSILIIDEHIGDNEERLIREVIEKIKTGKFYKRTVGIAYRIIKDASSSISPHIKVDFDFVFGNRLPIQEYQKIDAPPHLKRCGLNGARFLDDRRADHTLKDVVSGRHDRHESLGPWAGPKVSNYGNQEEKLHPTRRYQCKEERDISRENMNYFKDIGRKAGEEIAQERKKKKNLEQHLSAIIGIGGLIASLFFLSPKITGNIIGNVGSQDSSIIGAILFFIGIIGGFFWIKSSKR